MINPNYAVYRKQLKSLKQDMSETDIYQWYMGVVDPGWSVQTTPALGDDGKYHYVYITERDDGKIYFGKHTAEDLNDEYIGSGYDIQDGKTSGRTFKNTKLQFFRNSDEAFAAEKRIVNAAFLTSPLVLNHVEGGKGEERATTKPTAQKVESTGYAKQSKVMSNGKKKFWKFPDLRRQPGDVLSCVDMPNETCTVHDAVNVEYKGEVMTLMALDAKLHGGVRKYKNSLNGFKYGDKTLNDIKLEIVKEMYGESL